MENQDYINWRKKVFNIGEDSFEFCKDTEPKSIKNILENKNSEMLLQFYCMELLALSEYEYYFGIQQRIEVDSFKCNEVNNNLFMPLLNN